MVEDLTARQLSERLKSGDGTVVLDVREPWEIAICALPGSLNIPMGELLTRLDDLPREKEIAVICHHGSRSLAVAEYLKRSGFAKVYNAAGGIAAWARDVDSSTPTY